MKLFALLLIAMTINASSLPEPNSQKVIESNHYCGNDLIKYMDIVCPNLNNGTNMENDSEAANTILTENSTLIQELHDKCCVNICIAQEIQQMFCLKKRVNSENKLVKNITSINTTTDDTSTKILNNDTSTKILTGDSSTKILNNDTSTKILTDDSSTKILNNDTSTKILTDDSLTKVLNNDTLTKILTDDSSTKILTDALPNTKADEGITFVLTVNSNLNSKQGFNVGQKVKKFIGYTKDLFLKFLRCVTKYLE